MPKLSSVLLVDDDPTNNFLNQRLLQRLEVTDQVLVAHNGQEALNLLYQGSSARQPVYPALILLDIQMPIMTGIEFLQAYQLLPAAQQQATVVVVLTTSMNTRDLASLDELPAVGHINKPLTPEKLTAVLELHFGPDKADPPF